MVIKTEIAINATEERIWSILTNFDRYPDWNPFIKYVKGEVRVGSKIEVRLEPPGGKGMVFKPEILAVETNKSLRWLGHLLFKGLFDGAHSFEIIDKKDGSCVFIQSEEFKGLLVPFFKKQLNTNTRNGFEQMNQKLKELSEQEKPRP